MSDIVEGKITKCGEAFLTLIRWDVNNDGESWRVCAVIGVQGELPVEKYDDEHDAVGESAVIASLRGLGIHLAFEGGDGPGRPFARPPFLQYFGEPTRTIIVEQSGGLDI